MMARIVSEIKDAFPFLFYSRPRRHGVPDKPSFIPPPPSHPNSEKIKLMEIPFQRVTLHGEDVIILLHPGRLCPAAFDHIAASVGAVFPDNKAIVLEEGMTIGATGKADQPPQ